MVDLVDSWTQWPTEKGGKPTRTQEIEQNKRCVAKLRKYLEPTVCACKCDLFPPDVYYFEEESKVAGHKVKDEMLVECVERDKGVLLSLVLEWDGKRAKPAITAEMKARAMDKAFAKTGTLRSAVVLFGSFCLFLSANSALRALLDGKVPFPEVCLVSVTVCFSDCLSVCVSVSLSVSPSLCAGSNRFAALRMRTATNKPSTC